MYQIRVLLVEDSQEQQDIFRSSVDVFNDKNRGLLAVEFEVASSFNDAQKIIDGSFDGAILDLKLNEDEDGGNKIVNQLDECLLRVPVIFVTGYPDLVNDHALIVRKRARGSETYESDLELVRDIKSTGLTHIMGGRGKIEQTLNEVFLKNLLPQIGVWMAYGREDSSRTETALLRHTLNHLLQLLDNDEDKCFPEEAYIFPPLAKTLQTGSVVKHKGNQKYFVVLNPACDLVVRDAGMFKTDRILLLEIESSETVLGSALDGITNKGKKQDKLRKVFGNNYTDYFHWLPKTLFFNGGFLSFRKLSTLSKSEFDKFFNQAEIQISPSFAKDIVARFSSYYARQGQPDIDFDGILGQYIAED